MDKELVLLTGGARSGKSRFAVEMAARAGGRVLFLATMRTVDAETRRRIARHRRQRPADWDTVEEPLDAAGALRPAAGRFDVVVLDCLALWVASLMEQAASSRRRATSAQVERLVARRTEELLAAYGEGGASLIAVTNEVGAGVVPAYPAGRLFRDLLGTVNQSVAARADRVYYLVAGVPLVLKGPLPEVPLAR